MTTPNPGSKEAIELGCKCPVLDNAHGKGYMCIEGIFVYSGECQLHAKQMQEIADNAEEEKYL